MKRFALVFLLAAIAGCAKPDDEPKIQLTDVGYALHLPPAMQQALDSVAPGFHPIRIGSFRSDVPQAAAAAGGGMPALFAAVGDFDGNSHRDAVIEGTLPDDSALHVFAVMGGDKPWAVEVEQIPSWDADAVGTYLSLPTAGRMGAFQVVCYPDSSEVYQYESGNFVRTRYSE